MSIFQQLCPPLQQNLINHGWTSLRPIQELAFREVDVGKNVLLIAPTAGGKTHAAFLPLLNRCHGWKDFGAKILYIAPLRALLNNIENRLKSERLAEAIYLEVFKWHGDVSRSKKLAAAKRLPDILLTTPESLDVILCSPYVDKDKFFFPLDAVVIDEAHYFAGSERGAQLVSVLNRLEYVLNRDLQRICLSATVGNPEEVLAWLCTPSKRVQTIVRAPAEKTQREAYLNFYEDGDKETPRQVIVRSSVGKKSIIFEPSRKAAEDRSKDFHGDAFICHVHHSSVDKFWREKAELDLAEARKAATVIATCTLELGLDVGDLYLIQQEGDFPSVSSYLQRIGRTGRRHPPQRCLVHVTDEFDFLKNLAIMTLADEAYVEDNLLPLNFYHVLLQQLLMLTLGNNGFPIEKARGTLRHCSALVDITDHEFDELLEFWIKKDVLRVAEELLLIGHEVERRYSQTNYRDLYVLFDSPQIFEVWHGRMAIGTLDWLFISTKTEKFAFILAGKWWQVEEVHFEDGRVYVKPFLSVPPPATWISPRGHEVSYRIAQQIKRLLLSEDSPPHLQQDAARHFLTTLRRRARAEDLTQDPIQFQPLSKDSCEVVNYAGDRVNLLLTQLATKIKKWTCEDVGYASFRLQFGSEPVGDFKREFLGFLEQVERDKLLEDKSLLGELAADYDAEDSSKWSPWLPPRYRRRFLASQVFDVSSARVWIEAVRS